MHHGYTHQAGDEAEAMPAPKRRQRSSPTAGALATAAQRGPEAGEGAGGNGGGGGDERSVVELETDADGMDDGYRWAHGLQWLSSVIPSVAGSVRELGFTHVDGTEYPPRALMPSFQSKRPAWSPPSLQVAQVWPENRQGQPAPAQLLQVHPPGLQRAQAGGAQRAQLADAGHHLRGHPLP